MAFALIVAKGSGRGRKYRFEGEVTFGRDAANDVVLNQAAVSRAHARIERQGDGWALLDRGSANGTELNGAMVAGRARLREGDRIRVGEVLFEFREGVRAARLGERWRGVPAPGRATLIAAAVLFGGIAAERGLRPGEYEGAGERGGAAALASRPAASGASPERGSGSPELARAAYERGRRKLRERRIAPRNLFDAWAAFIEARGHLQGVEGAGGVLADLQRVLTETERDLERECRRLLFTAARFDRYGEEEKAQQAWREILLHFPGDDPAGCRRKAQENLVSSQPGEEGG